MNFSQLTIIGNLLVETIYLFHYVDIIEEKIENIILKLKEVKIFIHFINV